MATWKQEGFSELDMKTGITTKFTLNDFKDVSLKIVECMGVTTASLFILGERKTLTEKGYNILVALRGGVNVLQFMQDKLDFPKHVNDYISILIIKHQDSQNA